MLKAGSVPASQTQIHTHYYRFVIILMMLFMLMLKPDVGWGQANEDVSSLPKPEMVTRQHFMNKQSNVFMDKIPKDLYKYTNKIEGDGSLKFNDNAMISSKDILKILGFSDEYTFQLRRENKSYVNAEITYQFYQQYYNGIKVEGGGYLITLKNNNIIKFSPNLFKIENLIITAKISEDKLAEILNINKTDNKELLITNRFDDKFNLLWKIQYFDSEMKSAFIDAVTGKIYEIDKKAIPLTGTTSKYGTVNFNNYSLNGTSYLSSNDNRIKIYQNFNQNTLTYDPTLIPTTTSNTTWDGTSSAWKLSKQALFVSERVDHEFASKLGVNFPEIRVGTMLAVGAFAILNSPGDIYVGTLNNNAEGPNFALYDIIAHELGHILLNEFLGYNTNNQNAVLQEGLADVYGTYIENFILNGGTDWVMGNEEQGVRAWVNRDLRIQYCFNSADSDHTKAKAVGHWFYAITNGIPGTNISSIGNIEDTKNLALEALNRLSDPQAGVHRFRYLTLQVAEEIYGINSPQYTSVWNAWDRVCVNAQCPQSTANIYITNVTNYNTHQFIGGNIIIENGGTLNIGEIEMFLKNGNHIMVKSGGTLLCTRTTFNTCDGIGAWQGIIVNSGGSVHLNTINIYNAIEGIYFKSGAINAEFLNYNIIGNQYSDVGIKVGANTLIENYGSISGCKKGIEIQDFGRLTIKNVTITNCKTGIESWGTCDVSKSNFINCEKPIKLTNGNGTIDNNTISGNFITGVDCYNSGIVFITHNVIGSENNRGNIGILARDCDIVLITDNEGIYAKSSGVYLFRTANIISSNHIDVSSYPTGRGILSLINESPSIVNNYINANNIKNAISLYLDNSATINNNDIILSNPSSSVSGAIHSEGCHSTNIYQNIISTANTKAVSLDNSSSNFIECNYISSTGNGIDIQYNSDLQTIRGNMIDAATDLQIQSVIGEQAHHGNEFVGGTAEAIGLSVDEILLSQFKVDPTFPNHLPTNPNPATGWFVKETNPNPFNCNGLIIGPNFDNGLCAYWKLLKKLKDKQPNRFFINLFHLLQRAKRDTSFHLPNCIKNDTLLAQLCGVKKITDIFTALTKPIWAKSQLASIQDLNSKYAEETDEGRKEELRAMMNAEYEILQNIRLISESQDSLRLDSIKQELLLINCDSIIIQKWKEILLLYADYKQKDSVDIANRETVLSYSMQCADIYGDAIYLARVMAFSFTDLDFDQYDGCISPSYAETKISAIQEISSDIKIAPNPSNGLVHIEFPFDFSGTCKVTDFTGKIILTRSYISSNEIQLDLSHNSGVNLIHLMTDKGVCNVFKVIVIK